MKNITEREILSGDMGSLEEGRIDQTVAEERELEIRETLISNGVDAVQAERLAKAVYHTEMAHHECFGFILSKHLEYVREDVFETVGVISRLLLQANAAFYELAASDEYKEFVETSLDANPELAALVNKLTDEFDQQQVMKKRGSNFQVWN